MEQNSLSTLRNLISKSKVISFDFFDTLFYRPLADPEDLFDLIGDRFGIEDFRSLRRQAQINAFQRMHERGRREISLTDIYECFPNVAVDVEALHNSEVELELALTLPNPEMIRIFEEAVETKIVVVVSDMYFDLHFFQTLLEREGLQPHKVFVSSEENATKRDSGELFDCVIRDLNVEPEEILHIGDSPRSDVARAAEKGLRTYLYVESHNWEKHTAQSLSASFSGNLHRAFDLNDKSKLFQLGFVYGGPVMFSFLKYVSETAKADGIEKLLFVSRDGYLLHEAASATPEEYPPFEYLKGSRVSYMLAATDHVNFEKNLFFFADGAIGLSPFELFERIGISPPDAKVMSDIGFADEMVFTQANHHMAVALLRAFKWEILAKCRECRRGLFAYLNSIGINAGMKVALVDIGWSGTTLDAFSKAIMGMLDLDLVGYFLCLVDNQTVRERLTRLNMKSLLGPDNCSPALLNAIYENRVAVELMFSAPHYSVIGYQLDFEARLDIIEDPGRGTVRNGTDASSELGAGMKTYFNCFQTLSAKIGFTPRYIDVLAVFTDFISKLKPEQKEIFAEVYNFDAWASTRNSELRASEYLSGSTYS